MERHFIIDTNVLMNFEIRRLYFDILPYTVVVPMLVISELEGLRKGDSLDAKQARDALHDIELIQTGGDGLIDCYALYQDRDAPMYEFLRSANRYFSEMLILDIESKDSDKSVDDKLILFAEEYSNKNKGVDVILLSGDRPLRIKARNHNPALQVHDPGDWSAGVREELDFEVRVRNMSEWDDQLKSAFEKRQRILDHIYPLHKDAVTDELHNELFEARKALRIEHNRASKIFSKRLERERIQERRAQAIKLSAPVLLFVVGIYVIWAHNILWGLLILLMALLSKIFLKVNTYRGVREIIEKAAAEVVAQQRKERKFRDIEAYITDHIISLMQNFTQIIIRSAVVLFAFGLMLGGLYIIATHSILWGLLLVATGIIFLRLYYKHNDVPW